MNTPGPATIAPPIRILLVDDHSAMRMGLALILGGESDMSVVAQAGTGEEAAELFERHLPDITLMDLRMASLSGIDAVTAIRLKHPGARIIILTTYDRDEDIYQSMRAGAMGYIVKDTSADDILVAIRRVHSGKRHFPAEIAEKLATRLSMSDLSDREIEVLKLMTEGMSNKEIAQSLNLALGTVKFHVNNILTKLGASDRTQAVVIGLKRGLADL